VAAVVLGGASLAGGRASVIATAAGALFLTQLDQVVLSSGANVWAQYLIQGSVIGLGMALRLVPARVARRHRPKHSGQGNHTRVPDAAPLPVGGSSGAEQQRL
jgi:ribose transport system permease protein